ncbi:hypothetical protein K8354_09200 [Polaribacter litorisediminis]|uniref:hypothetical protein n=1 Tax=Polaribacter litorisediminis TaxID=1908341 RepID=UPI001CC0B489|nr:hypothetical protein [Polaribacter litorisediminis]UAM99956.1 hypothetical protein K8354_09200 [Polaribacter litorisediminis]
MKYLLIIISFLFLTIGCVKEEKIAESTFKTKSYSDLVRLFKEWRVFENPPLSEGAPDYTKATFAKRWSIFKDLQNDLKAIDTTNWPVKNKIDWMLVWAEMNGYDFNHNILKPWERDPAYYKAVWMYKSDVPAHEGPTNHGITEVWQYTFPLSKEERTKFIKDLNVIKPLNEQAKINLTGNAKDLWIAGIRDIKNQSIALNAIKKKEGIETDTEILKIINEAIVSTNDFVKWLENKATTKTGVSGIGKENYTWYLQKVHLVPLTWDDEVMILKRELARAWTALKLEEHSNRNLPKLIAANSPETYNKMADEAAKSLITFLEQQDIVTVKPYFDTALRKHLGEFIPQEERNFFSIGEHFDPRPLYSHFYHWFELARMDNEPHKSEIRREALLYNIFDSRNEGTATAVEEMFMQAGLYDDSPRTKEIVYIMIAQRAARGLGSLYAHANIMTMEEAGGIHSAYTPRGWMKTEKELLIFEQHLYLRQPGYGTSYITGKYLLENALADFARIKEQEGTPFKIKDFFDTLNNIGNIPISLGHWEMTKEKKHLTPILH